MRLFFSHAFVRIISAVRATVFDQFEEKIKDAHGIQILYFVVEHEVRFRPRLVYERTLDPFVFDRAEAVARNRAVI